MKAKIMWYHLNGALAEGNKEADGIHDVYGQDDTVHLTAINHPAYDWSDGEYLFKSEWVRQIESNDMIAIVGQ